MTSYITPLIFLSNFFNGDSACSFFIDTIYNLLLPRYQLRIVPSRHVYLTTEQKKSICLNSCLYLRGRRDGQNAFTKGISVKRNENNFCLEFEAVSQSPYSATLSI